MNIVFKIIGQIFLSAVCLPMIPIFLTEAPQASTLINVWAIAFILVMYIGLSYMIWKFSD